jgi:hypothetical protein
VVLSIIDREWPAIRTAFERWLDSSEFRFRRPAEGEARGGADLAVTFLQREPGIPRLERAGLCIPLLFCDFPRPTIGAILA